MTSTPDHGRKAPHPPKGGLSLILTFLASSLVLLSNLLIITNAESSHGMRLGPLVFVIAAGALMALCVWMWSTRYYLPWKREHSDD